ncbi:MAG TPA: diacylglycerol kinase family protein [Longilinea sp.]|nr:diacylglycerol kinase family protein [Longilinea sp.]
MPKYKIIINPIAGKGAGARLAPEIQAELTRLGLNFDTVQTERPGHGIELARQAAADGYDVVVAAGGDGTSNEVLNGLMQARNAGDGNPALGVLPIGRGNDFAFSMHIPTDWKAAALTLKNDVKKPLDVGLAKGERYPEGRYFGNGVGIGFDAVVGFVAAKSRLSGILSYLVAAIKTISLYFNAPTIRLELDDQTITQPFLMVSIMNGRRMGGSFMMAPQSKNDDGLFDLCLAGQVSRMGIVTLIPKFMSGTQAGHPAIRYVQTRKLTATAMDGTLPAHADGETLCEEGHELYIELFPRQLDLIYQPD